ncbi:hypothetical protein LTR37_006308 [Vermiconidia calcicola]|uniref:Uncharacterized protein n=1 Tax=Vermiconidia calcicola TaxID=1690605 RepID=A0ACC3NH66_9PEZI|nr:hypothetical protein LTR37_006308 [Vermiconidia calcicola]
MPTSKPSPILPTYEKQYDRFRKPFHRVGNISIRKPWLRNLAINLRDFFIATWLDWVTILMIGATAAGVAVAPHTFTRYFPVTSPDGAVYWPELAYPYIEPIFSSVIAGVLAALVPISVFLLAQLWQQSFVDFASAVLGLTYSLITGTCFQVILKKTIGGLRPHFLFVCKPVLPPSDGSTGAGLRSTMYTVEQVCTGNPDKINNGLESFPSGHAEVAFAGFGYLAIYLFTHLRITSLSRKRGSHWRMLLVVAPLLFATYLASSLVLGYHHHGYDVVFGALIGWLVAFMGYRMVFMGIIDGRWNTVPYLKLRPTEEDVSQNSNALGSSEMATAHSAGEPEAGSLPV